MSLKADTWIKKQIGMITPFVDEQVRNGVISYGLSSYGYDMRISNEFKMFTHVYSTVVDPKNFDENAIVDLNDDVCIIPPNSFVLARSVEYFRLPANVLALCVNKSTYVRCGISIPTTVFEPGWHGYVTIEINNTSRKEVKVYANEGIAQVLFFEGDEECEISYADKKGKYQGQKTIVTAKV